MTKKEENNLNGLMRDMYYDMLREYDYKGHGTHKSLEFLNYMVEQITETLTEED